MFYGTTLIVFLLDRLAKEIVTRLFYLGQSRPIVQNIFHLTYVRNSGALWGMMAGGRYFFIIAGIVILAVLIYFKKTLPKSQKLFQLALGLIAGGALGNLFDRVFYGSVIDFFDFRIWPVFNPADAFTDIGVVIIIFLMFKDLYKKEKPDTSATVLQ